MCVCPWQNQIHEANCSNAGEVKFCTRSYKLIHPFKNKFSIYLTSGSVLAQIELLSS